MRTYAATSKPSGTPPLIPGPEGKPKEDLTGRDQLVSNVVFSWAAHFVLIVAGFIMPRMIDHRLGQELLGIWDFAWSLVGYFGLVQMGVGSAVNRYVAGYRAAGDMPSVNRIVSSVFCIQGLAGLLLLGLTIALSLLLPQLFGDRLGENAVCARWVVFVLGVSTSIEMSFAAFGGVLTGCHRWELHNLIKSGWHVATVMGWIFALLLGGGLRSLAAIALGQTMVVCGTQVILAHRVCGGLRVRLSLGGWSTIRQLIYFGGKTLLPGISRLLLNQTTNVLIVVYLGPAALALYSRPWALISHMHGLVDKMAVILIPTTSSLQSVGNVREIRELLVKSVRYSFYMVLPIVLVLVVFGGPLIHFWMGPRYANGLIPAILAVGYLATVAQTPVLNILVGLNGHGRAGIAQFIASLCAVGLTVVVLRYTEWKLAAVAIAVTLPLTIVNVIYLPLLICRQVGLDLRGYLLSVAAKPAFHVLPFAVCLAVGRFVFRDVPLSGLLCGGLSGGAILTALYYRYVLPDRIKTRVHLLLSAKGLGV